MNAPHIARDLTKQAPHSPRDRIADFAVASRTVDKCRASLAGNLGEYHYDCPLDQKLFTFKGITGDQFREAVRNARTEAEIGTWLLASGLAKTPGEIATWSAAMEAIQPFNDPELRADFTKNCRSVDLDPEKATLFDWLEADDRASFQPKGGKPVSLIFNS